MLAKSKQSAFIMAGIAAFVYAVSDLLLSLAIRYLTTGNIPTIQDEFSNIQQFWLMLAIVAVVLIAAISFGGFLINILCEDDMYYGTGGAVRWACLGLAYALSLQAFRLVEGSLPNVYGLQEIIEFALIGIAYVVIFKILPSFQKRKQME